MQHKESFEQFLKQELNPEQLKAVTQTDGSLLVIAGAGSGKTRVITTRIAYLIIKKLVDPTSIVAVTFTNKAAQEMKKRILEFLGPEHTFLGLPFIGTFHSYCLRLLKQHADHLPHPFVSILDVDDQQKLLNGIIKRNNLQKQITAKSVSYQISYIKNRARSAGEQIMESQPRMLQEIYHAYEVEKHESKSLDFDDLLLEAVRLIEKNKDVKEKIQKHTRHILVDEYQDTNVTQHELLKQLTLKGKKTLNADSLCVVGDEDQSIYSWRGATVSNILSFKKDFPKTKTIKIEQNYRSVQPILETANQVIKHNKERNPKKLWSARKGSNRIVSLRCLSEYQEADAIAHLTKIHPPKKNTNDVAVLYRAHFQSRAIEEAFIKNSIPYTIIGGIQFYERKEIKDLLAYMRLVVNPFDRASFFRIINCPTRGLGQAFEDLFYERWHAEPFLSFKDVAKKLIEEKKIVKNKAASLSQFVALYETVTHTALPIEILDHFLKRIAYFSHLKDNYEKEDAESRIENIKELAKAFAHFQENGITTIETLLDEISLMQEKMHGNKNKDNHILMMTLHAAKGLEFDTVIITGLDEGILPSARSIEQDNALEEERRLLYVGITRAKERLMLTHARYRYTYGQMTEQCSSRFLDEIPQRLQQQEDSSYWNAAQFTDFFGEWVGKKRSACTSSVLTFGAATKTTTSKTKKQKYTQKPTQPPKITQIPTSTFKSSLWKKNQPVSHPKFGIGIVKKVEEKNSKTYLTISFKAGTKKIDAQFVKKI